MNQIENECSLQFNISNSSSKDERFRTRLVIFVKLSSKVEKKVGKYEDLNPLG